MNCLRSLGITFCFSGFGLDLFGYFILVESQNVSPFLVWFISLNIMTIRFVHIVALSELPTLKGRKRFHCVSTTVCLWNWLSMDTQIVLCFLASVNHAVVTMTGAICIFSAPFPNLLGTQHELELKYLFVPCVSFFLQCSAVAEPFQFIFLYGRILFKLLNIPCDAYSFTHRWTLEQVLPLGYCE